ncbi:MAG: beta strand repeat-containing protein, partial [Pseudomonadota bacterium]
QLVDITDLSPNARNFLSTPSSDNLSILVTNETGSGVLVFNDSPSFSGIPTVPTASSGTNTTQIASTAFVRSEISNLIDSAPSTLDTLNELAAALGDDANFATTVTNTLAGKANLSGAVFTGSVTIPSGTGNFNSLSVNGTGVSVSGHTHTSSQITDFASSVSGLLPTINNSGNNRILTSTGSSFEIDAESNLTFDGSVLNVSGCYINRSSINFDIGSSDGSFYITNNYAGLDYEGTTTIIFDDSSISLLQPVSGTNTIFNSGNFINALTVNNIPVSVSGHNHTVSNITNFNSGVSGLLPGVTGTGYVNSSFSGNTYTISVSGLQPSGSYASGVHSHGNISNSGTIGSTSGQILITGSGGLISTTGTLDANKIIVSDGSNSQPIENDANTLLFKMSDGGVPEGWEFLIQDQAFPWNQLSDIPATFNPSSHSHGNISNSGTIGSTSGLLVTTGASGVLTTSSGISSSYITNFNTSVSGLLPAVSGTGYVNSSFSNNRYTISVTGLQPSGNYSLSGHSHSIYDGTLPDINNLIDDKEFLASYPEGDQEVSILGHIGNLAYRNIGNISSTGTIGSSSGLFLVTGSGGKITTASGNYANSIHSHGNITSSGTIGNQAGMILQTSTNGLIQTYIDLDGNKVSMRMSGDESFTLESYSPLSDFMYYLTNSELNKVAARNILEAASNNHTHGNISNSGTIGSASGLLVTTGSSGLLTTSSGVSSSYITNFNSSVSGLLPVKDIVAGTGVSISSSSGVYTINSTVDSVSESASIVTTVFNKTASTITKGSVVYINDGQGDQPTIQLAIASNEMGSSKTYGIVQNNIGTMSLGKVVVAGALTGLNTDQYNPTAPTGDVNGTTLWLSPSTSGIMTTTKPPAPNHAVSVGTIVRTHQNAGVIEVRVQNGFELYELHDVAVTGATDGQFLQRNSSSGLWVASSSGNFSILQVNGTGVSVSGHKHTAYSEIADAILEDPGSALGDIGAAS